MLKSLILKIDKALRSSPMAVLYSLLVLILCVMPSSELPSGPNDKISHILAFLGIAFLWEAVWKSWQKALLYGSIFAVAIEIIQGLLPESFHRSMDWKDAVADVIGLLIGFLVYRIYLRVIEKLIAA